MPYFLKNRLIETDNVIQELEEAHDGGALCRDRHLYELRGLSAVLIREEYTLVGMLVQPSFPEIARIVGYASHTSVEWAVGEYGMRFRELIEERRRYKDDLIKRVRAGDKSVLAILRLPGVMKMMTGV